MAYHTLVGYMCLDREQHGHFWLLQPFCCYTVWGYSMRTHGSGRWQVRGYTGDKDQVLTRLRRIEGQVRGLQRLVDGDAYCIEVLTQISAVDKALKGVAVSLLDGHLRHCVRGGMAAGGHDAEAIVTEASDAIARLVRA
jgi:DNA-binding FrmR family transcriptional regulator